MQNEHRNEHVFKVEITGMKKSIHVLNCLSLRKTEEQLLLKVNVGMYTFIGELIQTEL